MAFIHSVITLPTLPILESLVELKAALRAHMGVVLEAPPGAGKSTVVPLALLDEPWVGDRKILMLEPRRLAARAVAQRMASTLGEAVGETVGYRMRLETRVSHRTRIEVVTEGVLSRILHSDPALEDVAIVIFDEFHERSLNADLGLALCLDSRSALGTDLRILVMSATLDGVAVAKLLASDSTADAPVISSAGRSFPVDVRHLGKGLPLLPGQAESAERMAGLAVLRALRECEGDVLVFLPGMAEIRRVKEFLESAPDFSSSKVQALALHGDLSAASQDEALRAQPGIRRVILSTNIAETSLTLPGIRVVIDSGLVRRAVFDPVSGMSRLETRRISRASAAQRAGRAGRVAAGVCYRLWSEGAERSLSAYTPAELIEADLMPLALDLAEWGVLDPTRLPWLDVPPRAVLESARDTLQALGALDLQGRITSHGRAMSSWPVHPRLAHLLLESRQRNVEREGARLAALLTERDILRRSEDVDITSRLDLLDQPSRGIGIDHAVLARVRQLSTQFEKRMAEQRMDDELVGNVRPYLDVGGLLALAYPDRIAQRRPGSNRQFLLANGKGAVIPSADHLGQSEFLVAIDLDDRDREAQIRLAAKLSREMLEAATADRWQRKTETFWSSEDQCVVAREVVRLGELIIETKPRRVDVAADLLRAMLDGIREMGLSALPWSDESRAFCARAEMARRLDLPGTQTWPEMSDDALTQSIETWLSPWLDGITRRSHLAKLPLLEALQFRLGADGVRRLDEWLPTYLVVPTGSRIRIDYIDDLAPCASMRMQEVFGLAATPRFALGKIPVTFKLLSPAQRPLQITADLVSFWRNAYADVRKDMRGRYPRHYWPLDPLQAEPTRRVKPRSD
ncbi:MAG: ATP-dependent helicase [Pseudomonadota bacterium]|jgi:ATP-dependent helicase HrpB